MTPSTPRSEPTPGRRRFLRGAVAGGVVAGAAPLVARDSGAVVQLRFQSAWSSKDIYHEYALDFAEKVATATQGRVRIQMLPAGSMVKSFDLLDAVAKGALDGAHAVTSYGHGKDPTLSLWGCGPAFGMDANMLLAWHQYGGGRALLAEVYARHQLDVVSFLYGPMPPQPLGWFKKPIRSPEDFQGLKFRAIGLAAELYRALGAQVNTMAGHELVAAIDRGLLDAAEFGNFTSDRQMGFPSVAPICMLHSFHQPSEQFEVLFNKSRFEALDPGIRAALTLALQAASAEMSWKAIDRYSRDYQALQTDGSVRFHATPPSVLQAQLTHWRAICARHARDNPLFAKVLDSMARFARRAGRWQQDIAIDFKLVDPTAPLPAAPAAPPPPSASGRT